MNFCFKVPAEAWRQLRDARWEKLQKADFFRCLGRGGDVFSASLLSVCVEVAPLRLSPLHNGALPTWKNRRPRCFDNRSEGAEGADILLAALARCSQLQDTRRAKGGPRS